ncbi:hypothetical protein OZX65_06660 [Leuconostocaceae bacterium ESL0723]|nr:hypothetical protein OZX65_06660 [Leuconostocaceae bacterium ESL0723]
MAQQAQRDKVNKLSLLQWLHSDEVDHWFQERPRDVTTVVGILALMVIFATQLVTFYALMVMPAVWTVLIVQGLVLLGFILLDRVAHNRPLGPIWARLFRPLQFFTWLSWLWNLLVGLAVTVKLFPVAFTKDLATVFAAYLHLDLLITGYLGIALIATVMKRSWLYYPSFGKHLVVTILSPIIILVPTFLIYLIFLVMTQFNENAFWPVTIFLGYLFSFGGKDWLQAFTNITNLDSKNFTETALKNYGRLKYIGMSYYVAFSVVTVFPTYSVWAKYLHDDFFKLGNPVPQHWDYFHGFILFPRIVLPAWLSGFTVFLVAFLGMLVLYIILYAATSQYVAKRKAKFFVHE